MKTTLQGFILGSLFFATGILQNSFAQTVSWQWAKSAGQGGSEASTGCALDPSGNLYATGWYTSPNLTFGAVTLTNATGIAADFFLTKYDAAGNTLWAKTYGGADGDISNAVATDASGNAYVTGTFNGSVLVMGTFTLTNSSAGTNDIFVAKIDPSGNVLWAKSAGGTSHDKAFAIKVDVLGNVLVSGSFSSSSINFGTGVLNNASTTDDIFLVKYDQSGTAMWARSAGGVLPDAGTSVSSDSLGNVYVAGKFGSPSVNFGTGALNNASSGSYDVFVVKYNSLGTAQWSVRTGGTMDDLASAIIISKTGVYVAGGYSSSSISVGSTTLTNSSAGASDIFLAKYDMSGNPAWAKTSGGSDFDQANALSADASGNISLGGFYISGSIVFGASTLTNSSVGYKEVFIAEYDQLGNSMWATTAPGGVNDGINGLAMSPSGTDIYISGAFDSSPLTFGPHNIYKGCGEDVFVAKMQGPAVGINEWGKTKDIGILYPNPSTGKFTVEAEGEIVFYNILGAEVYRQKLNDRTRSQHQFDLSSFGKGVYVYKVISEKNTSASGRLVIE
jgi:hypothetical protein